MQKKPDCYTQLLNNRSEMIDVCAKMRALLDEAAYYHPIEDAAKVAVITEEIYSLRGYKDYLFQERHDLCHDIDLGVERV